MTREEWAFVVSILVMLVMCASYFFKKKSLYLTMQGIGVTLLMVAYILLKQYFAMVGLVIGLARSVVYLWYEWKDKSTPIWWAVGFTLAGVASYFVINLWILGDIKPFDIIYLFGLAAYAFIFRIRNLVLVRYLVLIPTALSIIYNALIGAGIFVCISYAFEIFANLLAIGKHHLLDKKKIKTEEKEDEKSKDYEDSSVDTLG